MPDALETRYSPTCVTIPTSLKVRSTLSSSDIYFWWISLKRDPQKILTRRELPFKVTCSHSH